MKKQQNILIIGAGLCGSLLALRLGQRGFNVNLYEMRPDLRKVDISAGRSINLALSDRGLKAMRLVDVEDQVKKLCIPMNGRLLHDMEGNTVLAPYSGREHEFINSISRGDLNALLLDEAEKNVRITRALTLYESIEPEGGLEGMLAAQMVGTHSAALECLRRAAVLDQTFAGRDMALKHAQKLMTLYTQQLAALNKHRGKGQQKVTVEHVNVEAGGQAIVGNVETGKRKQSGSNVKKHKPDVIEHAPDLPLPEARAKKATAGKKR